VDGKDVTSDAERIVDTMIDFTNGDSNTCHGDPSKQENIEPNVENEQEILHVVVASDACVEPDGVLFPLLDAFFADVTVFCAWALDDFTFKAEVFRRYDFQ
jgi:hypothetical protein